MTTQDPKSAIVKPDILELEFLFPDEDDMRECGQYLLLRFEPNEKGRVPGIAEVAKIMGIPRSTMYYKVASWRANGTMDKARKILIEFLREENDIEVLQMLKKLPENLRRLQDIFETASGRTAVEAYKLIHTTVVEPGLGEKQEAGADELAFLQRRTGQGKYDPTVR